MNKTKIVSFLSYKGGVGRSITLANLAYLLANKGKRIVIIDFDLYSPSIAHMKPFKEAVTNHLKNKDKEGGIFENIIYFKHNDIIPSILDFYTPKPITDFKNNGEIYIIPSGKEDKKYRDTIQSFDWKKFYEKEDGREYFFKLRGYIEFEFHNPDYIFIDLPSGISSIGSIGSFILADQIFLFSNMTEYSINGCKLLLETIKTYSERRIKHDYLKPINISIVLSPVPEHMYGYDLKNINKELGEFVQLPYNKLIASGEDVIIGNSKSAALEISYLNLVHDLLEN